MSAPPIIERHLPHFHRRVPVLEPVRAATVASITISTALNNGDSLDGVTLATGDRVLVKDQSTPSQNGIYVVGTAPDRDYDLSTDDPDFGFLVYVREGTANGGTLWRNTNTAAPTIGSTSITFAAFSGSGLTDPMTTRGDLIIRNSSNVTARLGIGAAGKILSSDGTDVSWGNGPMTTQDDLIVGGASGIPTRLGKGSDGDVLTVDPTTHHLVWAAPGGGGSGTVTTVKDEGSTLSSAVVSLDFVGAGVTATGTTAVTVTIPGGGGSTVQYPALKPATPTYDFAGAALDGAFSAHSSQGSFGTGDCLTQGIDWGGSSVELEFSAQMGAIYVSHSNTDFDFTVGGIKRHGLMTSGNSVMFGIAALNSSGTGVGVLAYDDSNCYIASITTWSYGAQSDSWSGHGHNLSQDDFWFRLKRVGSTWTGYASQSGRAWDKVFSTRSDSITVDRLVFGLLYNSATAYSGRLTADYFQVDV